MKNDSYIDSCLLGMGTAIAAMDPGQRQVLATNVELLRCLEREVRSDASQTLVCADDIGMIRATQGSEVVAFTPVEGATSAEYVLPALGLKYWITLGMATTNVSSYRVFLTRAGTIVGQFGMATFDPDTANPLAGVSPCICVGAIQTLTLTVRPTAAFAAGATFELQVFRDFNGPPGGRGSSCKTGC